MPLVEESDLVLHYAPRTRAFRALWFLEELGRPYAIRHVDYGARQHKSREFLRLNPMGKLPVVTDGDVPIAETGAIFAYLADRYAAGTLAPAADDRRRADYLKWLFFAAGVMEPAFGERFFKWQVPAEQAAWGDFAAMAEVVTEAVAPGPWLLGEDFTAADVFVGSTLRWGVEWKLFADSGPVADYVGRCLARPALRTALELEERFAAAAAG